MSDYEQIAQVAPDKGVNVSDSLRTNEQMSESLGFMSKSFIFLYCSQKMSDSLKNIRKKSYICTFFYSFLKFFKKAKDSLIPSEQSEQLLRSLRKNERPWAIRSGRSEGMSDRDRIAQVAHQKWAIHCGILWWNSQPWRIYIIYPYRRQGTLSRR